MSAPDNANRLLTKTKTEFAIVEVKFGGLCDLSLLSFVLRSVLGRQLLSNGYSYVRSDKEFNISTF